MKMCVRSDLSRQNDKNVKGKVKTKTIEQRILENLDGLRGGCYKMDCICQIFPGRDNGALSKEIADVFNKLIISGRVRLSLIRIYRGRATVYFTVKHQKTLKEKR